MCHLTYIALQIFLGCPSDDSFTDVGVCSGVTPNKEVTLLSFRHHSALKVLFLSPRAINVCEILSSGSSKKKKKKRKRKRRRVLPDLQLL